MTDQINPAPTDATADTGPGVNRRRMFIAGAGLAGAAVLARSATASAADDDPVLVGNPDNVTDDGATVITNTNNTATSPGTAGQEAVSGVLTGADNGSHAIKGVTAGLGHSVAGDTPAGPNTVAATWGRHGGLGAGIGGVNTAPTADLAGTARGVEGAITSPTNGSHAVFGSTNGAGHSIAGDTPAMVPDAPGSSTMVPNINTTASTWGRHGAAGAGIGGVSAGGYGGEFVGGKAPVRLIPGAGVTAGAPADTAHKVGELFVDGNGDLFYNRADGANFTKLNNQGGVTLFTDAQRAFDSREEFASPANTNKGRFGAGEIRTIDLGEFTDLPVNASGAVINLTAATASGLGFASVFNGDTADADRPNNSAINWVTGTNTIANGIIVAMSSTNRVKVYTKEPTEIIIDVVGYVS